MRENIGIYRYLCSGIRRDVLLQLSAKEEHEKKAAEHEALQERARASQMTSGIREEIINGLLDQDWEGLTERTITQTIEESEEVFGYISEIEESAQAGADKALEEKNKKS